MCSKNDSHNVTEDELEDLFVNRTELDEISAYLNRFNPIRVMRMESMEIRHSAILAWLLDPNEQHGFDDKFLRYFLSKSLVGAETGTLAALEVLQADLRDAEIQREKRNMDIFVYSPSNGWAFVIENKFHSKERDGQLTDYIDRARKDAEEANVSFVLQGIFLTLHGETPSADAADQYVTLGYSDVCEILSSLIALHEDKMAIEVRQFLEHYLDVIREATGMSEDQDKMANLARKLYRSHKKALDFIMEHGVSSEFMVAAESIFGENLEYGDRCEAIDTNREIMYHAQNQKRFSFLPITWVEALGGEESKPWDGCTNWWAEYPVICWFQLNIKNDGVSGTLFLYSEVGPLLDKAERSRLIERIQECAEGQLSEKIKFGKNATEPSARFSRFFNKNRAPVSDISDAEAIKSKMEKLINDFNPVFDAVENGLRKFSVQRKKTGG